jgi:hypothetical protein
MLVSVRRSNRIRVGDDDAEKDCLNAKYPWFVDDSDNISSVNDRLKFVFREWEWQKHFLLRTPGAFGLNRKLSISEVALGHGIRATESKKFHKMLSNKFKNDNTVVTPANGHFKFFQFSDVDVGNDLVQNTCVNNIKIFAPGALIPDGKGDELPIIRSANPMQRKDALMKDTAAVLNEWITVNNLCTTSKEKREKLRDYSAKFIAAKLKWTGKGCCKKTVKKYFDKKKKYPNHLVGYEDMSGGRYLFDEQEKRLAREVQLRNENNVLVFKRDVIGWAMELAKLVHSKESDVVNWDNWYRCWLKRLTPEFRKIKVIQSVYSLKTLYSFFAQ